MRVGARTGWGVFAGFILGLVSEPLLFWSGPPEHGIRLPWIGPAIGMGLGAAFGWIAGGVELRGHAKRAVLGCVWGTLAGLLAGAFIFPFIIMILATSHGETFDDKALGGTMNYGILRGVPLGAAVGLMAGCISCRCRNNLRQSTIANEPSER